MIGGQRNPVGTGKSDVTSDWLIVEVKERQQLPRWIQDDLDKARKKATDEQLGIVLLHQKGKHDDVILVARSDWEAWFGFQKPIKEGG